MQTPPELCMYIKVCAYISFFKVLHQEISEKSKGDADIKERL